MTLDPFPVHLLSPPPSAKFPSPRALTEEERLKIDQIEAHFAGHGREWAVRDGSEETAPLGEWEMIFLSRETFIRFLIATKGDAKEAINRLEKCIIWRRTANVDDMEAMAADCEYESTNGKNLILGFTPSGQPVLYFFPSRNITPVEQRRAIHAAFMVERARDLMVDGVTNLLCVFNFAGKRQGQPTSVSVARETLHILGNHYPENLSRCVLQNLPWFIKAFVNLMWPFVDPATKEKVKFGSSEGLDVVKEGDVNSNQLLEECGGEIVLPYEHDKYWPALLSVCKERRANQLERWRKLGPPRVGREERQFKVLHTVPAASAEAIANGSS